MEACLEVRKFKKFLEDCNSGGGGKEGLAYPVAYALPEEDQELLEKDSSDRMKERVGFFLCLCLCLGDV